MKSGGETCWGHFRLPAIVKEYSKGLPALAENIKTYCSYSPSDGDVCVSPPPQQQDFCDFQTQVTDLGTQLNARRQEYLRWAEKAETTWNAKLKKWGVIDSVATQSWGKTGSMYVRITVSDDSTQILLTPYVARDGGQILDAGFDVWRNTPQQVEAWLEEKLGSFPRIFGGCASRMAVVEMRDNRIVDDLAQCWVDSAGKAFDKPWLAWTMAFHNLVP